MTGRTCLKHGVPEWCPEGVCRWCPEPEPEAAFTFMGVPIAVIPAIAPQTTVRHPRHHHHPLPSQQGLVRL
jgi:hypothetical protein